MRVLICQHIVSHCSDKHNDQRRITAVSINDKADVIFDGSDAPTALGCLYSIGAIAQESNRQITASVTDLLEPFGVDAARIYINFL